MLFGLSIGLTVALVVYLTSGQPRLPNLQRQTVALTGQNDRETIEQAPPAQPPGEATGISVRDDLDNTVDDEFTFYEGLRNSTVAVSEDEFDFDTEIETLQEAYIQAGSFPTTQAADSRRASLALLGYESFIEHAVVNGKAYRRVIIGPLNDNNEISRTRRRLRNEGIDTVLRVVTR
jgi:cell division protein FtsN